MSRGSHDKDPQSSGNREILILNLDTFAKKNVLQIHALEGEGYSFTIVSNDMRRNSRALFDACRFQRSQLVLLGGTLAKVAAVWKLLRGQHYHHVEFYAASRLAPIYLMMLKLLHQKVVVIERGDIDILGLQTPLVRRALKLAYRLADLILYKEVYMSEPLRRLTSAPLVLVPNCVDKRPVTPHGVRDIDFLWVNRTIVQRRPEWVASALADARLADRSLVMLGIEDPPSVHCAERHERLTAAVPPNTTLHDFIEPDPFYGRARYFCLPATIVFGNNALLEAMAAGVVPVVTEASGVELVVEDGVNGIVTAFDEMAYRNGMVRAASLTQEKWHSMSQAAVETVGSRYSLEAWTRKMADVYARVGGA